MQDSKRTSLIMGLLACLSLVALADNSIPNDLRDWQDWVMKGEEFRRCPLLQGNNGSTAEQYVCQWYGSLNLSVNKNGAQMSLPVEVLREQWVELPGNHDVWPQDVRDGGKPLAVVERLGRPQAWLSPGRYQLSASFHWSTRPAQLLLPSRLLLTELSIDGRVVAMPARDADNLWLGAGNTEKLAQDNFDMAAYRHISDGLPLIDELRLELHVSGRAREMILGQPLLPGFVPVAMQGPLAAKLDARGVLTVQVLPGHWILNLQSRAQKKPETLQRTKNILPWPETEIWSFTTDERLRSLGFEGGTPVDPQQSGVPAEWQALPNVLVQADTEIHLNEHTRGLQVGDNALQLTRNLWLRFDGEKFSFRDHIQGSLHSGWRLDMDSSAQLQYAQQQGQALTVTRKENDNPADKSSGIELRDSNVDVFAGGEFSRQGSFTAASWQTRFDSVKIALQLPPGYRLFAAPGVDNAPGSFMERWNLLDCFVWVLIAALVFRATGWIWALLSLCTVGYLLHELDFPSWLLLNAVAAVLLARLGSGALAIWLRRYRLLSLGLLLLVLLPFSATLIRNALHAQLENVQYSGGQQRFYEKVAQPQAIAIENTVSAPEMEEPVQESDISEAGNSGPVSAVVPHINSIQQKVEKFADQNSAPAFAPPPPRAKSFSRYSASAVNQAGNGIPEWNWRSSDLSWNGPVEITQSWSLWIIPYWLNATLLLSALTGLLLLVWRLSLDLTGANPLRAVRTAMAGSVTAGLIAVMMVTSLPITDVQAATPDVNLLNELKARLSKPPECAPTCIDVTSASVLVDSVLQITLDVNALHDTAMAIPGVSAVWLPSAIDRDGERINSVLINGLLYVRVTEGVHHLHLQGALPNADRLSLSFPQMPRHVEVHLTGWEAMGLDGDRLPSGSLELLRAQKQDSATVNSGVQMDVLPMVRVRRQLFMELDWRIETRVERFAPAQAAFNIRVPLMTGETPTSSDLTVEDGQVNLRFAAGEPVKIFSSVLARSDKFEWQAGDDPARIELWDIAPSALWRVNTTGTPLLSNENGDDAILSFAPRINESLSVMVARPVAVDGVTLAFDRIQQQETIGDRSRNGQLIVSYRATQGSEYTMTWPEALHIVKIEQDGRDLAVRPRDNKLPFSIQPGKHVMFISYQGTELAGTVIHNSAVDVGMQAANISTQLDLPANRWILYVYGPALGPVVLYWSLLLTFVLLAWAMARTRLTPLGWWQWCLLGLGLSTVSGWALAAFVVWLLALQYRSQHSELRTRWGFNGRQLLLILWTLGIVIALISLVPMALLSTPDMMLTGNNSYAGHLQWFADHIDGVLPVCTVISLPMWVYKAAMLLWAIWLSFAMIQWLSWCWTCLNCGGFWRPHTEPLPPGKSQQASAVDAQEVNEQGDVQEDLSDAGNLNATSSMATDTTTESSVVNAERTKLPGQKPE